MRKRLLHSFKLGLLAAASLCMSYAARGQYTTAAAYPFAATQSTYTYLTGGTTMSTVQQDDNVATNIPIGFSFNFAGTNYTTVTVGSNGWLSFANITASNAYNDVSSISSIAPCIMPLWDDVDGAGGSATYLTTGTAPNRVFTVEWRNWEWYWAASSISISFQVKLYEDTRIQILYKEESGTVSSPSASIGIAKSGSDYQSLNNTSTSPTSSSTTFTSTIGTRPTTGQSYMWGQPPCQYTPVSGSASNITSSKATINWANSSNGVPPQNYEIVIDQNAGNPTGAGTPVTGTTYTKSGLTPGTNYYAHVRGRCSGISTSNWLHIPFATTLCIAPKVSMANITHESALALWNSLPVGINYQYIYNTTGVPPTSDLGAGNTTSNSAQLSGLSPDTHYYLYMRTQCTNNETSDWEPTEFTTMIECQAPDITLIPLSNTDKQATWSEIPTAVAYEYAVNSSPTPPSLGTLIYTNNVKFSIPNDDKGYYLHVRSKCVSIFTSSEWSTKTVREPSGTAISNVNAGDNLLLMAYPNPSTGVINVDLNGLQNNAGTVTLTDIMGKALYSTQATNSSLAIDMTHLPAGIYIIKYSDKNQNQVLKVTKQ